MAFRTLVVPELKRIQRGQSKLPLLEYQRYGRVGRLLWRSCVGHVWANRWNSLGISMDWTGLEQRLTLDDG